MVNIAVRKADSVIGEEEASNLSQLSIDIANRARLTGGGRQAGRGSVEARDRRPRRLSTRAVSRRTSGLRGRRLAKVEPRVSTSPHVDDAALISRLLAGDPETVALVRTWMRATFTPYRARLADDLEDLEQEILLDLTQALRQERFQAKSRLRTYVRTYVHHKCIDRIRAMRRREWVDVDDLDLPSRAPSALDELAKSEATDVALRVFEEMPESCRELWRMLEQGMRYQEMSRRLGVAEGTLRARVLRCRRRALEVRERLLQDLAANKTG